MVSAQDYYPGGMLMPGRNMQAGIGLLNRNGYNGKRNDNEVYGLGNFQDYGMRGFDPRLIRFWGVDPLTKKYPWYTPYQFAGNKFTRYVDLDGAEEWLDFTMQDEEKARANHTMTDEQIRAHQDARGIGALIGAGAVVTGGAIVHGYIAAGGVWGILNGLLYSANVQNLVIGGLAGLAGYNGPDIPEVGVIASELRTTVFVERELVNVGKKQVFGGISRFATLIMEKGASFTNAGEKKVVQKLLSEGSQVVVKAELKSNVNSVASGQMGDIFVNGIKTEIKSIAGVRNATADGISKAIKDRLSKASGQAKSVILDLVDQAGATEDVAERGVARYFGQSGGNMREVRVMGSGYDKVIKNPNYNGN